MLVLRSPGIGRYRETLGRNWYRDGDIGRRSGGIGSGLGRYREMLGDVGRYREGGAQM